MRHIGKYIPPGNSQSRRVRRTGWFRDGQKSPVLKSSGKKEEHKPSRRRAVALLTAVQHNLRNRLHLRLIIEGVIAINGNMTCQKR